MAEKESTFLNMVATLFVVALISSAALGYVYEVTKEPIAAAELAKKVSAIQKVLPEFTNNPIDEGYQVEVEGGELTFYPAMKNDSAVGTAVETFTNKGFGGRIKLMVGMLPGGAIYNIAVIECKETPGLGNKIEKKNSDFSLQFNGQDPASFHLFVKQDGGDVDAITAATISSRAFCDAVTRAYAAFMKERKQ